MFLLGTKSSSTEMGVQLGRLRQQARKKIVCVRAYVHTGVEVGDKSCTELSWIWKSYCTIKQV